MRRESYGIAMERCVGTGNCGMKCRCRTNQFQRCENVFWDSWESEKGVILVFFGFLFYVPDSLGEVLE